MIIKKNIYRMILKSGTILYSVFFLFSITVSGQKKTDSLFTEFNLTTLKKVYPAIPQTLSAGKSYIRNQNSKSDQKFELIKVYADTSANYRKATVLKLAYGVVLAFDELKTYGYEKVLFFGDKDYYYDSLLIVHDTLFFKEMSDDHVELAVVYPVKNDTLFIKYGSRNTRTDFLSKIYYQPALKNYLNWFVENMLDYKETYTLVKKDSAFELTKVDTNRGHVSEYDFKRKRQDYLNAGLSPFWIALSDLAFLENLNDKKSVRKKGL
jgi:hypothetical protein